VLDGEPVDGITPELRTLGRSTGVVANLAANKGRCFQGPIPVGAGFIISADEAQSLLAHTDADYRRVIRPYLTGDDIAADPKQQPRRWIIDFATLPLETAMRYPAALAIVRERVKPARDGNRDKGFRELWWRFGRPRIEMRRAIAGRERYIGSLAFGKRLLFSWQNPWTCPSGKIYVFAFDDDYSMGVLPSFLHGVWAVRRSATLEDRFAYTPSTAFETFPWPTPITDAQRARVAEASRKVVGRRQEICAENSFGLTSLYNAVDDGAYTDLKALHDELDEAVAATYGWPKAVAHDGDEIVHKLLVLNREIAAGERQYDPFGAQTEVADGLPFPS
jgi:hypothetical protein